MIDIAKIKKVAAFGDFREAFVELAESANKIGEHLKEIEKRINTLEGKQGRRERHEHP
jgi:hypothetical protein